MQWLSYLFSIHFSEGFYLAVYSKSSLINLEQQSYLLEFKKASHSWIQINHFVSKHSYCDYMYIKLTLKDYTH